jgi:3-oxoacyl-[acyl-carrier protein] reductase
MGQFENAHVLITGGTSGIGRACAVRFAAAGARVSVTYRSNVTAATRMAEEFDVLKFLAIRSDATIEADTHDAVRVASEWAPIDVLVNNVGAVIERRPALQLEPNKWREVLAVNIDSTYFFTRNVLPGMLERKSGSIVNVSAHAASSGGAGNGSIPYAVAKAGVETMTRGLARELARTGVRVNAVRVGLVDTPLHDKTVLDATYGHQDDFVSRVAKLTPMGRAADPTEIAECIAFLASPQASYVTGAVLCATGGM